MLAGLVWLALPAVAHAVPFTMTDVAFSHSSGATGTISLVGGAQGIGAPGGSSVLSGATAGDADVLVFQVTVTAGSIDELRIGVVLHSSTGSGWVPGPDVDVAAGPTNVAATRSFTFDGGGSLDVGETSDPIYVSYGNLAITDGAFASFGVVVGGVSNSSLGTIDYGSVPEPASVALLASALVGVGGLRRRR